MSSSSASRDRRGFELDDDEEQGAAVDAAVHELDARVGSACALLTQVLATVVASVVLVLIGTLAKAEFMLAWGWCALFTIVLDHAWFFLVFHAIYGPSIDPVHAKMRGHDSMRVPRHLLEAVRFFVYYLLSAGLAYFAVVLADGSHWLALGHGAFFASCVYGVYNGTTAYVYPPWSGAAPADLLWGVLCQSSVALLSAAVTWAIL